MAVMALPTNSVTVPVSLIYQPPSFFERLDLARMFAQPQPLEVELGCGDSTVIVELARRQPAHNFIGVERLRGRIKKLDRKGRRAGLSNLCGLCIEATYCLEYLLPFASVSSLHVYFPDPWPKRRHWDNRLVNTRFTELAAQILVAGGVVFLRTDDVPYFTQMTEVFGASKAFQSVDTPPALRADLTDFERDFLAKGIQTNRAACRKV